MEIKFTEENIKSIEEQRKRYPEVQACIMHALWLAQNQFGWLSEDVMKYVGDYLGLPHEHVFGVAHFYTMYNKKPVGKHHIQVCTNVSCMLRGGYEVLDYISERLNIKNGETSADGKFTLSEAECLGSCGTAPMFQLNDKEFYENLDKDKIDSILLKLMNN